MSKFTYGYIREATMAHLDLDEEEAQAMNLLKRFHIFANEAMQAICSSKPMYKYIQLTIVKKFTPIVYDEQQDTIRLATEKEVKWNVDEQGERPDGVYPLLSDEIVRDYYHNLDTYEIGEKYSPEDNFLMYADKETRAIVEIPPTTAEILEAEAFDKPIPKKYDVHEIQLDHEMSYVGRNQLKFYKPGKYYIPARYLWYRFDSGLGDDAEIDMPTDILLTIPLYIASVCLQIDNPSRAAIKRNEFETALARCSSADFMPLNKIVGSW